jgi:hypothetical protein
MAVDLTALPATIDGVHLTLAALALLFLVLFLLKRGDRAPAPVLDEVATAEHRETTPRPAKVPPQLKEASPDAALQLLSLLQQEARFIDFLQEDLAGFSDADIGAVARVVHEGGQRVLGDYFAFVPVRSEEEESRITLPEGFNATEVRLTGNVMGQAPFTGTLVHRGWKAVDVKLPKLAAGHDARIIAPAEVEL